MKKSLLAAIVFATIFTPGLSAQSTEEYVDFLYKCMPLPDSLDYPREYFARNVETTLKARKEMPWGEKVPEREFRYFVLPIRVNNENLDESRQVFYEELKDRVKGLSMEEAALEVNHWCHEKANYHPSDARTSSPLATVKTGWGRCGEESTFAVAALRSVGIPARQVYTPRWAHTDDNHAWVEVWIDGKWHYLGACEPEPKLDMAWFTLPASRALLMHTTILGGDYDGPEEVIFRGPASTEINVTENYAPVETYQVTVTNQDGTPAQGAKVKFSIYNYAEYYPAVTKIADKNGIATLTSGLGDMLVWASDGTKFGYGLHKTGEPLKIILDKDGGYVGEFSLEIKPPKPSAFPSSATEEETRLNASRFQKEDSIRAAYASTFQKSCKNHPEYDRVMEQSYGNWQTLCQFAQSKNCDAKSLKLLELISEKDRRDISPAVLEDAYGRSSNNDPYVLNPRIANEMLTSYRAFFQDTVFKELSVTTPDQWTQWVKENIQVDPQARYNPKRLYISPKGVYSHRKDIDKGSRDLFYIAGLRSLNVPAMIDPITGLLKVKNGEQWHKIEFDAAIENPSSKSSESEIIISCNENPEYYTQFSLSKIENGFPVLLNYDEGLKLQDLGNPIKLEKGQYILTAGRRKADGSVAANSYIFQVPGPEVAMAIPHDAWEVEPLERINHDLLGVFGNKLFTVLSIMRPGHEPSTHAFNDITPYKNKLEQQGAQVHLLYFKDVNPKLLEALNFNEATAPTVVLVGADGKVYYKSEGYQIGLGKILTDLMAKLTH